MTRVLALLCASLLCPIAFAQATEKSQVAVCSALTGAAERLSCFDAYAKKIGAAGPQAMPVPSGNKGKWSVKIDRSPIDDSENVTLSLDAEKPIRARFGPQTPTIILRCKENQTDAYINWSTYLGLDETDVLTRFDQEKASTTSWGLSTDNEATFVPNAISTIKKMASSSRLIVQVTPYGESPVMAEFSLSGLNVAVENLRKRCGW